MDQINLVEPTITLREDILKLHILYLEKLDHLSKAERDAYEKYLTDLSNPMLVIKETGDIGAKFPQ